MKQQQPSPRDVAAHEVRRRLRGLRPLVTMSREGLVLIAIESGRDGHQPPAYVFADEAVGAGLLEVREVAGGSVPTLEAVTRGRPVLLLAGDTVEGGKQNRVVNVTIWLGIDRVTPIPVTCLEQGRWSAPGGFAASRRLDPRLRNLVTRNVAEPVAREEGIAYAADQGAVWNEIENRQARAGVRSASAALHDVYRAESADLDDLVRAFPVPSGASGVGVGIGGRLVSLEVFDGPDALQRQWQRVVESAARAYLDHKRAVAVGAELAATHRYPDEGALGRMIERAAGAVPGARVTAGVGEGLDVRFTGSKVHGAGLVREGVVHLELLRAS